MSSYYPSFSYLNKNSQNDFGWIVASLDPDNGEQDSGLSVEQIYTDSYRGTKRILYGARYNTTPIIKITLVKCNGSDFTVKECRDAYRWLTGNPSASWLDLCVGDEVQYSFLVTIQDLKQYKLDARTVALTIYAESISPWAYSSLQTYNCSFGQVLAVEDGVLYNEEDETSLNVDDNGVLYNSTETLSITDNGTTYIDNSVVLTIDNETDDLYTPIYLNTVFTNNNSDYISIKNTTTGEETIITNMVANEIIKLSAEQFVISDVPGKIFGNTFNFVWPRLVPGVNELVIDGSGSGHLEFTYRYPIKIGDCAMNVLDTISDSDCGCASSDSNSSSSTGSNCNCTVDEQALQAILNEILI